MVKEIFGKEGHKGVNPDEVVAIGAAIQGAQLLLGSKSEVLLVDVTPLTLGIETEGGILTPMIERNTSIPAEKKDVFSTASDNQTSATIRVFQGESQLADSPGNRLLGQFNLEGIPPAPRGVPKIEVTYAIDANGILHVSAKDLGTGKEQKITITASSGLSKDEIEQMRQDAESHAEEDRKHREEVELRNDADNQIYRTEKMLRENADKLSGDDKSKIENAVAAVKDALKGSDLSAIKSGVEKLNEAWQTVSEVLYKAAAERAQAAKAQGGASRSDSGANQESGKKEEGPIIDAEVVDEKKG